MRKNENMRKRWIREREMKRIETKISEMIKREERGKRIEREREREREREMMDEEVILSKRG